MRAQYGQECEREHAIYTALEAAKVRNVLRVVARCALHTGSVASPRRASPSPPSSASASSTQLASVPEHTDLVSAGVAGGSGSLPSTVLLLSPVCLPFSTSTGVGAPLKGAHLGQLVDAVRDMHCAGYLHRDVRPANIGCGQQDGQLYLLDAGFAVQLGSGKIPWEGTLRCASPTVLDALAKGSPVSASPSDDLRSLVRCCHMLLFPHLAPKVKALQDPLMIKAYWAERLANGVWSRMESVCADMAANTAEECAQHDAYDQIKDSLTSLV
jgi:hypothetical protein